MRERNTIFRRIIFTMLLLLLVCTAISCKKKEEAPAPAADQAPAETAAGTPAPAAPAGESAPEKKQKRKVIHNHAVDLEVKDFQVALNSLTRLVADNGGYIFKSTRESGDGVASGTVGVRVPAGQAGSVLAKIPGVGKVVREDSTAEDITEGYVDLEARLNNAKASEARLLGLFRQAGKLSEVLEVEEELTRVRGDIEAFEAKRKNWDLLTEMVTIEIHLYEHSSGFPSVVQLWRPIERGLGGALTGFADSLHALIVFVGAVLPWVAVFGPVAYFFAKRRGERRQRQVAMVSVTDVDENDTLP